MSTSSQTPDYGEPWHPSFFSDCYIDTSFSPKTFEGSARRRAIACVNACAGMADPAAEIQAMRNAIKEAYEALLRVSECKIFYTESMDIDNHTTDDCASALAKLKPFTTP